MGEPDPLRLRDQPKKGAVPVEAPGPARLDDLEAVLIVPVEELVRDLAGCCLVGQLEGVGAEPLNGYDRDEPVRENASDR